MISIIERLVIGILSQSRDSLDYKNRNVFIEISSCTSVKVIGNENNRMISEIQTLVINKNTRTQIFKKHPIELSKKYH